MDGAGVFVQEGHKEVVSGRVGGVSVGFAEIDAHCGAAVGVAHPELVGGQALVVGGVDEFGLADFGQIQVEVGAAGHHQGDDAAVGGEAEVVEVHIDFGGGGAAFQHYHHFVEADAVDAVAAFLKDGAEHNAGWVGHLITSWGGLGAAGAGLPTGRS